MSAANSGIPEGYAYLEIPGNGACGYNAQALACFLYIQKHENSTPAIQELVSAVKQYYDLPAEVNYSHLRAFMHDNFKTRTDVFQFLVPVIYSMHQNERILFQKMADALLDPGEEPLPSLLIDQGWKPGTIPASVTNNEADYEQLLNLNARLGLNEGQEEGYCSINDSEWWGKIPPASPEHPELKPDFRIMRIPGHFDLLVNTQSYPPEHYANFFHDNERNDGYFKSKGMIHYAVDNQGHGRQEHHKLGVPQGKSSYQQMAECVQQDMKHIVSEKETAHNALLLAHMQANEKRQRDQQEEAASLALIQTMLAEDARSQEYERAEGRDIEALRLLEQLRHEEESRARQEAENAKERTAQEMADRALAQKLSQDEQARVGQDPQTLALVKQLKHEERAERRERDNGWVHVKHEDAPPPEEKKSGSGSGSVFLKIFSRKREHSPCIDGKPQNHHKQQPHSPA
jgi:hypothetical protein